MAVPKLQIILHCDINLTIINYCIVVDRKVDEILI